MNKQVLSIEQMRNLQKLGLDTSNASMVFCKYDEDKEYRHILPNDESVFERYLVVKYIPAYTLQDVLGILPETIKVGNTEYNLSIYPINGKWAVDYCSETGADVQSEECEHLVDSAYSRLCWCIRQGFINSRKEARP